MIQDAANLKNLRPYQCDGVKFLFDRDNALLADEMGLGKTVQTAVALHMLFLQKKCKKILIICPASLCNNWESELRKWTSNLKIKIVRGSLNDRKAIYWLPFQVYIASYETIRSDIDFLEKEIFFNLVVLDEAQRIKNINSSLALSCRLLNREKSWALTGTPLENQADDLISIYQFIKPGLLHAALPLHEIHSRIKDFFLRRKKIDVLNEMPPIIIQDLLLEMDGLQKQEYDLELYNSYNSIYDEIPKPSSAYILAQITKLKQICNFERNSGKMEALNTIIENLQGPDDKLVVFSQYVETLKKIEIRIKNIPVLFYYGQLDMGTRSRIIEDFEKNIGPKILLISLKAGGVGLNLSTASLVILFDRWWNPAVENQAIQRGHRFGRLMPLHVIKFLIKNSIEERIQSIIQRKLELFIGYIENADVADIGTFSKEELIEILNPSLE